MKFPKSEGSEKFKLEKVEKEVHKDIAKDVKDKDKDKEKEGKDIKDKEKEKEGKDIKDKEKEKETAKDHKDVVKEYKEKEHKEKELYIGESPQEFMQAAVTQAQPAAAAAAAQPQAALKFPDKPLKEVDKPLYKELEKIHKDKELLEKIHIFDKVAKIEKEYYPEYIQQLPPTDPGGPVEQRLAALEAAVSQLSHFIPQELRPDLSKGALKQEPEEPKKAAEPEKKK